MSIKIVEAYDFQKEIAELFTEYTEMLVENDAEFRKYLEIQHYDDELRDLKAKYGPPQGRLYIAFAEAQETVTQKAGYPGTAAEGSGTQTSETQNAKDISMPAADGGLQTAQKQPSDAAHRENTASNARPAATHNANTACHPDTVHHENAADQPDAACCENASCHPKTTHHENIECNTRPAACIGLRRIDDNACEMKRLYVRPEFRGQNIGRILVRKIIDDAKEIGCKHMQLDTLPFLKSALRIYREFGFYEIPCYNDSPMKSSIYMQLDL